MAEKKGPLLIIKDNKLLLLALLFLLLVVLLSALLWAYLFFFLFAKLRGLKTFSLGLPTLQQYYAAYADYFIAYNKTANEVKYVNSAIGFCNCPDPVVDRAQLLALFLAKEKIFDKVYIIKHALYTLK